MAVFHCYWFMIQICLYVGTVVALTVENETPWHSSITNLSHCRHTLPSSHNSHTFHPSSSSLIILQKTTLVLLPPSLSRSLHLNHPSAQKHETETQENTHTNPPFTSSPLQHHTIPLPKNTKQNPLSLTSPSIISFTPQTNPSHTVTNKPEPHSSAKHSSLIFPNQPHPIIAHRWTRK